jgi:hypothetical protein
MICPCSQVLTSNPINTIGFKNAGACFTAISGNLISQTNNSSSRMQCIPSAKKKEKERGGGGSNSNNTDKATLRTIILVIAAPLTLYSHFSLYLHVPVLPVHT